jgi:hypothetical protein
VLTLYNNLYDINIGTDLSCFDLILDISTFITEPTLISSLQSITKAHEIIRSAVGYYLTKSSGFKFDFQNAINENQEFILYNSLLQEDV